MGPLELEVCLQGDLRMPLHLTVGQPLDYLAPTLPEHQSEGASEQQLFEVDLEGHPWGLQGGDPMEQGTMPLYEVELNWIWDH